MNFGNIKIIYINCLRNDNPAFWELEGQEFITENGKDYIYHYDISIRYRDCRFEVKIEHTDNPSLLQSIKYNPERNIIHVQYITDDSIPPSEMDTETMKSLTKHLFNFPPKRV